jgi:hypothetical protein
LALILSFALLTIVGCSEKTFAFQTFTFPPGEDLASNSWEYQVKVTIANQERKPMTDKTRKSVVIEVHDANGRIVLENQIEREANYIFAQVFWEDKHNFSVFLIDTEEITKEFIDPQERINMIQNGDFSEVAILKYHYNLKRGQFEENGR